MTNYISLSKIVTEKSVRPWWWEFRKSFWENFSERSLYKTRRDYLLSKKQEIQNKKFFRAKIDYESEDSWKNIANSNMPSKIFEHTKLNILKKKNNEIVVNGDDNSINEFFNVIQSSSYLKAKQASSSKDTTLSREVYCFKEISSIHVEDIIIWDLLSWNSEEYLDLLVELYSEFRYSKWQAIINKIGAFLKNWNKWDIIWILWLWSEIIENICIDIKIKRKFITNLIEDIPEIQTISETPKIKLQRSIESSVSVNFSNQVENSNIIVWVFDQWTWSIFSSSIFQKEKIVEDSETDHWTKVASKILFGRDLNRSNIPLSWNINLTPFCKLLDIKVVDENNEINDFFKFCEALQNIVTKYPNVHLYNLSLWFQKDKELKTINTCTAIIDKLAKFYDKVFIISAWNTDAYTFLSKNFNEKYEDCLNKVQRHTVEVLAPWDAINWITIWSIAESFNENSIAKNIWEISPFSRIWINRNWIFLRKPDLVEFWWNVIYSDSTESGSDENLKSLVINHEWLIKWDIWTSFSAPIITNICAHILDFFENSQMREVLDWNRLNLIKWLLIHKTAVKNIDSLGNDENLLYWYWQPWDIESIIWDSINMFTFLHLDNLLIRQEREWSTEKTHVITIDLPWISERKELKVVVTLCYTPPIDKNFITEYTQINMKPSVKVNWNSVPRYKFLYKYNEENSPIKNFCFKYSNRDTENNKIEIKIQATILQHYLKRILWNESHNYALFVTLIDESWDLNIREQMIATDNFEIIQPIEIPIEV